MGHVLTSGLGQNPARQASIHAGIPVSKPAHIINQVCGSGLRSVISGYQSIKLQENKIIVAVTGETDYVTDGKTTYAVSGGHEMMTKVTATGCALTCLIGAAIAVGEDKLLSTAAMIGIYGLTGKMASKVAKGPGSLRMHLLDNLTNLTKDEVLENINIQNV